MDLIHAAPPPSEIRPRPSYARASTRRPRGVARRRHDPRP
jgi:hypothetical protein